MAIVNGNYMYNTPVLCMHTFLIGPVNRRPPCSTHSNTHTHLSLAISKWFLDFAPTLFRSGMQGVTGRRVFGVAATFLGLLADRGVVLGEGCLRFRDGVWGTINSSSLSTSIADISTKSEPSISEPSESVSVVVVVTTFFLDGIVILGAFRAAFCFERRDFGFGCMSSSVRT